VANIAQYYGKTLTDAGAVDDLALQLELGVPKDVLPLARDLGAELTRGDYLALHRSGLVDWAHVKSARDEQLVGLLGRPKADLLMDAAGKHAAADSERSAA
jgi:hypothetical protein